MSSCFHGFESRSTWRVERQVHTTGMDIQHKLDAVAALTLGKDMRLGSTSILGGP